MNVWDDDLEVFVDRAPFGSRRKRLVDPATARVGASVWEIAPHSTQLPYHFHHVQEEFVVVLRGRPVLRTPDGERELADAEVAEYPDSGKVRVVTRGPSQNADRLVANFRLEAGVDYLDGEL